MSGSHLEIVNKPTYMYHSIGRYILIFNVLSHSFLGREEKRWQLVGALFDLNQIYKPYAKTSYLFQGIVRTTTTIKGEEGSNWQEPFLSSFSHWIARSDQFLLFCIVCHQNFISHFANYMALRGINHCKIFPFCNVCLCLRIIWLLALEN